MDKKTIISKTILFIFVVGFVIGFKSIFGEANTLIGVTTITAILMFLERDLTLSPIKNTFRLVILNLFIGIASVLATSNMYLAIPVNFITMFTISYLLCYSIKKPLYLPFSLQYLFLLANPVEGDLIPIRLLSLVVGAICIMIAQVIANKNRIQKSGNKILASVCDETLNKIKFLNHNKKHYTEVLHIKYNLNQFRSMIYDQREADYYLTEEARIKLNLSVALESINLFLDKIDNLSQIEYITDKLELLLLDVKEILESNKNETNIDNNMKDLLDECEERNISDLHSLQILDSIILLYDTTKELKKLSKKDFNKVKKIEKKPEIFKTKNINVSIIKNKSIKYTYAIRIATAITFGGFIVDYFKIPEGRWILFTLLSVINPIYEVSKTKTKDRIVATLIGALIVFVLFSIFKDSTTRSLIVMLSGYIGSYLIEYRHTMITTTVSAIGAAAIIGNIQILTISRVLLVLAGVILALLINRLILPYSIEDSYKELKRMYSNIVKQMFNEIHNLIDGKVETYSIKNLFILASLIENKSLANTELEINENHKSLITEKRLVITNVYELYMFIKNKNIDPEYIKEVLNSIKYLIQNDKYENIEENFEAIESYIRDSKDLNTKITLSSILIILEELSEINKLNAKAQI